MRKLFSIIGVVAFAALFIVACSKAKEDVVNPDVSQEVLNQISDLGFSSDNVVAADGGYIVEGDIFLSPKDLTTQKTANRLIIANEEQYRTNNLVNGPRTITVSISGRNVTQLLIDGVQAAVARYNAENLQLSFSYVGTNGGGDINISVVNTGQYIASAGFPTSGGDPYGTIKYARTFTSGYSVNFVTTVIAHEMGHCIGFRHTDYMNRSYSCGGSGGNEGSGSVGAVHIPGTPTTPDKDSWMLACLSASTNRPFNQNDKVALDYLY
jgi:Dual-action HEIGH metallo-peptidase